MDTRMIDVALGLVLVFALASLAVSTLHEIWISLPWNRARGDNLLLALCSLLGDDQVTAGRWKRAAGVAARPSAFTQLLLAHPLLQSQVLGKSEGRRTPSYLDTEVFVSALLAQLTALYADGQRPDTPQAWVNAVREGRARAVAGAAAAEVPAPNDSLVQGLAALVAGASQDWPAYEQRLCAWFDSVMARSTGWFQRDTQVRLFVIGMVFAAAANINPLLIVQRLWSDSVLRTAMAGAAEQASKAYGAELAASAPPAGAAASAALAAMAGASAATPAAVAALTAAPLSAHVDSVLRRYKEALFRSAEARGQHKLGNDTTAVEDALDRLLDLERQIALRRQSLAGSAYPQWTFDASVRIEASLEEMLKALDDAHHVQAKKQLEELSAALRAERAMLLPREVGQRPALGACSVVPEGPGRKLCVEMAQLDGLAQAGLPLGWSWANWPGCDAACQQRHGHGSSTPAGEAYRQQIKQADSDPTIEAKQLLEAYRTAREPAPPRCGTLPGDRGDSCASWSFTDPDATAGIVAALGGWAVLALAGMLGAPFWFDLLGKLVKLRASTRQAGAAAGAAGAGGAAASGAAPAAAPRTTLTPPAKPAADTPAPAGPPVAPASAPAAMAPAAPSPAQLPAAAAPAPGRTPLRTDGSITVLGEAAVRRLYGDIATHPDPAKPGFVVLAQGSEALRPLVRFAHAALAAVAPQGLMVHARAEPHFRAVFDEILNLGLVNDLRNCGGTVAMRHIGCNTAKPLSRHCWGIAIDLNTAANGYGVTPPPAAVDGSVMRLVPVFEYHGFAWGGRFTTGVDAMHFELALQDPAVPPRAARTRAEVAVEPVPDRDA